MAADKKLADVVDLLRAIRTDFPGTAASKKAKVALDVLLPVPREGAFELAPATLD